MKRNMRIWKLALIVVVFSARGKVAIADVVSQQLGSDYLVVEAEDFDLINNRNDNQGFLLVSVDDPFETPFGTLALSEDTNASRGEALIDLDQGWNQNFVSWQLQFSTPGTYTLYAHYSMFEFINLDDPSYGQEDSFFLSPRFDLPTTTDDQWYFDMQGNGIPEGAPSYWEGNYHWAPVTVGIGNGNGVPPEYVIGNADIGKVLEFNLGDRDRGSSVDAWIFSLDPFLTEEDLDELLNTVVPSGVLQAGDADQDWDFDQLDLVKVQISARYLSGQAATWGDGDWNGAPGGEPGNPPSGNGFFDQLDIISALAPAHYLTGPYGAIALGGTVGDEQTSLVYDINTGELSVDSPLSKDLTSINITSAGSKFIGGKPAILDGAFDNFEADNIFKATFGGSFGDITFGNVLPAGLSFGEVAADLTVVGSLSGGGEIGNVDLLVPEPSSVAMLALSVLSLVGLVRRRASHRQPGIFLGPLGSRTCGRSAGRVRPKI